MANPFEAAVFYFIFLFSTTLHEAAHAWVALRGGDPTAYRGGQVSVNPLPHIRREPFGMVVLPLLSVFLSGWPMGFASAPYDPLWARRYPQRAALMSLAGPAANLLLVLVATLLLRLGLGAGIFSPGRSGISHLVHAASPGWESVAFVLSVFFTMNLILFVLNIMPVPPLDGSGALPFVVGRDYSARVQEIFAQPMVAMMGMLLVWRVFGSVFRPVFRFAVGILFLGVT